MTQRSYRRLFKGRKRTSDDREITSRFPPESAAWETIEYLDPDDKSFICFDEEPLHEYGKIYLNLDIDTVCCHEDDIQNFDNDDYRAMRFLKMLSHDEGRFFPLECPHLRNLDVYARGLAFKNIQERLLDFADTLVESNDPSDRWLDDEPTVRLFDQETGKLDCMLEPKGRGRDGYIFFE